MGDADEPESFQSSAPMPSTNESDPAMTPATRPSHTNPSWGVNVSRVWNGSQRFPSLMLPRMLEPRYGAGRGSGRDRLPH